MDSVHAIRDENEHVGFKEALDDALKKRNFFIKRTLKNNNKEETDSGDDTDSCSTETYDMNIWKLLLDGSIEDGENI